MMSAKKRKSRKKKRRSPTLWRLLGVAGLSIAGLFLIFREVELPGDLNERWGRPPVPSGSMLVHIYFGNSRLEPPEADCSHVFPVDRLVPETKAVARAAVTELLEGPNPAELEQGYFTSINPGVSIRSLAISDGAALVDFSSTFSREVAGSCQVSAIRAQVTRTLLQFPSVNRVSITVEGGSGAPLQP